jgi:hypothetical protein
LSPPKANFCHILHRTVAGQTLQTQLGYESYRIHYAELFASVASVFSAMRDQKHSTMMAAPSVVVSTTAAVGE